MKKQSLVLMMMVSTSALGAWGEVHERTVGARCEQICVTASESEPRNLALRRDDLRLDGATFCFSGYVGMRKCLSTSSEGFEYSSHWEFQPDQFPLEIAVGAKVERLFAGDMVAMPCDGQITPSTTRIEALSGDRSKDSHRYEKALKKFQSGSASQMHLDRDHWIEMDWSQGSGEGKLSYAYGHARAGYFSGNFGTGEGTQAYRTFAFTLSGCNPASR